MQSCGTSSAHTACHMLVHAWVVEDATTTVMSSRSSHPWTFERKLKVRCYCRRLSLSGQCINGTFQLVKEPLHVLLDTLTNQLKGAQPLNHGAEEAPPALRCTIIDFDLPDTSCPWRACARICSQRKARSACGAVFDQIQSFSGAPQSCCEGCLKLQTHPSLSLLFWHTTFVSNAVQLA